VPLQKEAIFFFGSSACTMKALRNLSRFLWPLLIGMTAVPTLKAQEWDASSAGERGSSVINIARRFGDTGLAGGGVNYISGDKDQQARGKNQRLLVDDVACAIIFSYGSYGSQILRTPRAAETD
jgi:hypothetical protein